jgi:hypothetical protein
MQHISLPSSPECGLLQALQKRMLEIHARAFILQAQISVISSLLSEALLSASSVPTSATGLVPAKGWVLLEKPVVAQPLKRFPLFYGIRQIHYHVHKSPPLVHIWSKMNSVHTHILFLWVHFIVIFPSTPRFSSWSLLSTHFRLLDLVVVVQLFTKFQPLYAPEDKSTPLISIRIQLKPVRTGLSYVSEIYFNIISLYRIKIS